jgi:sterol desaturase/sphingolipid hydroxylase (fatty acid hydroxylase superfamily)
MTVVATLDGRITDYATLVALVLVLLTLFTSQRANTLTALERDTEVTQKQSFQEMVLDGVLGLVTLVLFATGLPLLWDAVTSYHPTGHSGPLRGGFTITWLLLIALVVWQVLLFRRAKTLQDKVKGEAEEAAKASAHNGANC